MQTQSLPVYGMTFVRLEIYFAIIHIIFICCDVLTEIDVCLQQKREYASCFYFLYKHLKNPTHGDW